MMVQRDSLGPGPVRAFARSVVATGRLAATGRLKSPRTYMGSRLQFADGTTSFVFRETVVGASDPADPAVLVVQFRLWALGRSPSLHALFRRECILHTPLFAGFPGFRSKLWASDITTGVYRGLYQWDGAGKASEYAATLARLLRPFSTRGSVRYRILSRLRRDDVLRDPELLATGAAGEQDAWWRLVAGPTGARRVAMMDQRTGPVDVLVVGTGPEHLSSGRSPSKWLPSGSWCGRAEWRTSHG